MNDETPSERASQPPPIPKSSPSSEASPAPVEERKRVDIVVIIAWIIVGLVGAVLLAIALFFAACVLGPMFRF